MFRWKVSVEFNIKYNILDTDTYEITDTYEDY